jgi:hypothetical protein
LTNNYKKQLRGQLHNFFKQNPVVKQIFYFVNELFFKIQGNIRNWRIFDRVFIWVGEAFVPVVAGERSATRYYIPPQAP